MPLEFVQESRAQFIRWMIHLRREPFSLAFNLVNPFILLVFMGGAFQGLARDWIGGDYRAFLLPGVLVLTVFGNSMAGGIPLLFDKENGVLLRLMSTPISRASILVGRFLAVNAATLLQCLIMLALGFLFGIRVASGFGGVLALLLVGLLLGFGVTVVSLLLAFRLTNHGDFFAILGITALPLTFLSSAFVPLDALPGWMRVIAWMNPMTYAVDGMRSLILDGWDASRLGIMLLALLLFDGAIFWFGGRILQRHLA